MLKGIHITRPYEAFRYRVRIAGIELNVKSISHVHEQDRVARASVLTMCQAVVPGRLLLREALCGEPLEVWLLPRPHDVETEPVVVDPKQIELVRAQLQIFGELRLLTDVNFGVVA